MMRLPVLYVCDLLEDNEELMKAINDNSECIFAVDVDEEYKKGEMLPIIRVNQVSGNQSVFASGVPNYYSIVIQVDVWDEKFGTIEPFHTLLDKIFIKDGWVCITSILDKDSEFDNKPRLIKRYKKNQYIKTEFI